MNVFAAVFEVWRQIFRHLWAERADKKLRALDDANAEADRLLYLADPEFAIEMGCEPPLPIGPPKATPQQAAYASSLQNMGMQAATYGALANLRNMASQDYEGAQMALMQKAALEEQMRASAHLQAHLNAWSLSGYLGGLGKLGKPE